MAENIEYRVLEEEDGVYAVIRRVEDPVERTLEFERAGTHGWESSDAATADWREAERVDEAEARRLVKEIGLEWE